MAVFWVEAPGCVGVFLKTLCFAKWSQTKGADVKIFFKLVNIKPSYTALQPRR
jgi:hypothetical protein